MDVHAGWSGTVQDLSLLAQAGGWGWTLLVLLVGLPLGSVLTTLRGSRLAVIPLVISAGVGSLWFVHHATGWWHHGLALAVLPVLALGAGWCLLLVAAGQTLGPRRATAS